MKGKICNTAAKRSNKNRESHHYETPCIAVCMCVSEKKQNKRNRCQCQGDPETAFSEKAESGNTCRHEKLIGSNKKTDILPLQKSAPVESRIRTLVRRKVKIVQRIAENQHIPELILIDKQLPSEKSQKASGSGAGKFEKFLLVVKGRFDEADKCDDRRKKDVIDPDQTAESECSPNEKHVPLFHWDFLSQQQSKKHSR